MADIGELKARITAVVEDFNKGMGQVNEGFENVGKSSEETGKKTKKTGDDMAKSMAMAQLAVKALEMAAKMLADAFQSVTFAAFNEIDAQAKMARQLGMTNQEMATMTRAAELSGLSVEQLTASSRQFENVLGQAISRGGEAEDVFNRLGVSSMELEAASPSERMVMLGEAFDGLGTHAERAAISQQLFGESGLAMLNVMEDAEGTMGRAAAEVDRFGLALSEQDTRGIERINDNLSALSMAADGARLQIAAGLAPAFEMASQMMLDSAGSAADWSDALKDVLMDTSFMEGVADVFGGIAGAVEAVKTALMPLVETIGPTLAGIAETWDENFAGAEASVDGSQLAFSALAIAGEALASGFRIIGVAVEVTIQNIARFVEAVQASAGVAGAWFDAMFRAGSWDVFNERVATAQSAFTNLGAGIMDGFGDMVSQVVDEVQGFGANVDRTAQEIRVSFDETNQRTRESFLSAHSDMLERYRDFQGNMTREAQQAGEARIAMTEAEVASGIKNILNLTSAFDKENRVQFEIQKAAKLAMVAMDGWAAVQGAYAVGSSIGGPIVGGIFAGIAGAASAVNFANLAAMSFDSPSAPNGASGGGGGGGAAAAATQTMAQPQSQGSIFLNIQGEMFDGQAVRNLIDKIAEAQRDGYQVVV